MTINEKVQLCIFGAIVSGFLSMSCALAAIYLKVTTPPSPAVRVTGFCQGHQTFQTRIDVSKHSGAMTDVGGAWVIDHIEVTRE